MTSAKYYSNWLKEAGRGHISAILAWGGFALYLIFKVMSLSVDTDFSFFGIGSAELSYLCMGLGILLAFSEFNYLFQAKKQDFYYSLPVKEKHDILDALFPWAAAFCLSVSYHPGGMRRVSGRPRYLVRSLC